MLWQKYVWQRQTTAQLAGYYQRSQRWIRNQLDQAPVTRSFLKPQPVVVVADMTFEKQSFGVCVLRSPHLRKNLIWKPAQKETVGIYHECRLRLQHQGFDIVAAVIDGKPGLIEVFWDVPVQMCQFHQIAIITRYLTSRPRLEAGQALRALALTVAQSTEEDFQLQLRAWYIQWESFLREKTFNQETNRWFYTHKRLRSAYRSLKNNLGLLFTYQRFPKLNIPNTTNSLDGTFSHLKDLLRIHRGLKLKRKLKLIEEFLSK